MNDYRQQILADADNIWDAISPDSVDDWWEGGKERIATAIAEAIDCEDADALYDVIMSYAGPALDAKVEALREEQEEAYGMKYRPEQVFIDPA